MRPPVPYYGGKATLAHRIAQLLPPHRIYIEPFAGSAAVLFAKAPVTHEVINDLDANVATFFRALRDQPEALARACQLSPYSRQEYIDCELPPDPAARAALGDVELARRFFVRTTQGYNANGVTGTRSGSWSCGTIRRGSSQAKSAATRADRLYDVAQRLRTVTVDGRSYEHVLRLYDAPDAAIYVDPPYLGATRASLADRRRARDYAHDFTTVEQHQQLAEVLRGCRGTVLLSGYHSPIYDELYADWPRLEIPVHRPSTNQPGRSGAAALEVIWSNRPVGGQSTIQDFIVSEATA